MSLADVHDYLMKQMRELANSDMTPEEQRQVVERAKVSSQIAAVFIEGVKVEIYAARLLADTGYLPRAVNTPRHERIPFDGKPR